MKHPINKRRRENTEKLLSDYVDLCNRVMAENRDKFWYRQAKSLNRLLWGGANFRTVVYEGDPSNIVAEFTLHFDPDLRALQLLPPGDHKVAFTWKASTAYLRDVVHERPSWFLEHPLMLDWVWMKRRMGDQIAHRVDGRSHAAGVALGVAAAVLASAALSRRREKEPLRL
jgi:hypothetical protein